MHICIFFKKCVGLFPAPFLQLYVAYLSELCFTKILFLTLKISYFICGDISITYLFPYSLSFPCASSICPVTDDCREQLIVMCRPDFRQGKEGGKRLVTEMLRIYKSIHRYLAFKLLSWMMFKEVYNKKSKYFTDGSSFVFSTWRQL